MFCDDFGNLCLNREEGERIISLHRIEMDNPSIGLIVGKETSVITRFLKGYQVFGCMCDSEIQSLLVKHSANMTNICDYYRKFLHMTSLDTLYLSWRIRCNARIASLADKIVRNKIGRKAEEQRETKWEWNPYKDPKDRAIKGNYTMDYLDEHFSGRLNYNKMNNSYMLDGRPVKVQELMRQCGLMKVAEDLGRVY